jgi:hypothetical protein
LHLSSELVREMISRIFSCPSSAIDDEAIQGRIRAEQISNIKRYLSAMLLANVCNAAILIVALWASPQHQLAIAWASATLVFTLYHGFKNRHSDDTKPSYVSHGTIIRTARNALFFGSLWQCCRFCFSPMHRQLDKLSSLAFAPVYSVAGRLSWPASPRQR